MKTRLKEGKNGSGKTMEAPMKVKTLMSFFFFFEIENNQVLSKDVKKLELLCIARKVNRLN